MQTNVRRSLTSRFGISVLQGQVKHAESTLYVCGNGAEIAEREPEPLDLSPDTETMRDKGCVQVL